MIEQATSTENAGNHKAPVVVTIDKGGITIKRSGKQNKTFGAGAVGGVLAGVFLTLYGAGIYGGLALYDSYMMRADLIGRHSATTRALKISEEFAAGNWKNLGDLQADARFDNGAFVVLDSALRQEGRVAERTEAIRAAYRSLPDTELDFSLAWIKDAISVDAAAKTKNRLLERGDDAKEVEGIMYQLTATDLTEAEKADMDACRVKLKERYAGLSGYYIELMDEYLQRQSCLAGS